MKKNLNSLLLLAMFATPSFAEGMYGSVSIGNASSTDIVNDGHTAAATSYSLLLGYEFSKYFSEEIGFISLLSGAPVSGYTSNVNATASNSGFEVAALVSLPVNEDVSLFARLGWAMMTASGTVPWPGSVQNYKNPNLNGLMYGPGIKISFDKTLDMRVGYNIYVLTGSNATSQGNSAWVSNGDAVLNNLYVSGIYHF